MRNVVKGALGIGLLFTGASMAEAAPQRILYAGNLSSVELIPRNRAVPSRLL